MREITNKDIDDICIELSSHIANASVISICVSYIIYTVGQMPQGLPRYILSILICASSFYALSIIRAVYRKSIKPIDLSLPQRSKAFIKLIKGLLFIIYIAFWIFPPMYTLNFLN